MKTAIITGGSTIGTKYKLLMILAKFLPCSTVRWLVGILYG